MGVNPGRIEALFRHQLHGAMGRAPAFAPDTVDINVVAHEMCDVGGHRLVGKRRKADLAAAIGHVNGLVDRRFRAGAFNHIVGADPAGELPDDVDRVLVADIDDAVGAQFLADRKPLVAGSCQHHRARAECLGHGHRKEPDWAGTNHHDALAGHQSAEFGEAVHRGAGGNDQRRFRIGHGLGHGDDRIDVIDCVFGKAAVGRKAVGPMPLLGFPVVEARGVHALAAALALAAARMDFDGHALADLELVDMGAECCDRAHIFMARREVLVEGKPALDAGRRSPVNDFEVGGTDRDGIDADQHFGAARVSALACRARRARRVRPAPRPSSARE